MHVVSLLRQQVLNLIGSTSMLPYPQAIQTLTCSASELPAILMLYCHFIFKSQGVRVGFTKNSVFLENSIRCGIESKEFAQLDSYKVNINFP